MMDQRFRPASLVPAGLIVDDVSIETDLVLVRVRSPVVAGRCPDCGATSQRVQSRFWRRAKDLPLSARRVELQVQVRRFRCDGVLCGRQIFAERFNTGVLAVSSRRTERFDRCESASPRGPTDAFIIRDLECRSAWNPLADSQLTSSWM